MLFKGVKILEFNNPKIKKTIETKIDQILISLLSNKGQKAIIKKTIKKNNTKASV